jgi:hypothetical protein
MILIQWKLWTTCCVIIQVFIIFSAFYAHRTNAKRAPDDPEKKDFSPYSPWLAPIVFPILILINIPMLILSSLLFSLFLLLFPFALLLFRKPFLITWILKQAQRIGNKILKINTALLRVAGIYTAPIKLQVER